MTTGRTPRETPASDGNALPRAQTSCPAATSERTHASAVRVSPSVTSTRMRADAFMPLPEGATSDASTRRVRRSGRS